MKSYKDLEVWSLAIDYVTEVYRETGSFPESEKFGLVNQMRRAAVSIPSNIAEGASRQHTKEFVQFLYIGLGSINELYTQLTISFNLKYIDDKTYQRLVELSDSIGKMLNGLIKYLKTKIGS